MGGPCIRPPNSSRSSVIGCVRKYELSKKVGHQGIFLKKIIELFSCQERAMYVIYNL